MRERKGEEGRGKKRRRERENGRERENEREREREPGWTQRELGVGLTFSTSSDRSSKDAIGAGPSFL